MIESNENIDQVEKKLEADIFVNRRGLVLHTHLRTSVAGGDRGMLAGQSMLSGLKITPRIFGFCGGSHQLAAAFALESAWNLPIPFNAKLIRSIAQATEIMQNIPRWFYTTCAPDLINPQFSDSPLFEDVNRRFAKFRGTSFKAGFMASRFPIGLYALLAGQWPHADFIIPGGVTVKMQLAELAQAYAFLNDFRKEWLEPIWLGGSLERYLEIKTWEELIAWTKENEAQGNSDLSLYINAALACGFDQLGSGNNHFLSYGAFPNHRYSDQSNGTQEQATQQSAASSFDGKAFASFDPEIIRQLLQTSGIKEVHYQKQSVEVGPLARLLMLGQPEQQKGIIQDPLFLDIYKKKGANVLTRNLARMHEVCRLFYQVQLWLSELKLSETFAYPTMVETDATGLGLTEAPRGALAHYIEIENKKIKNYQILAPTVLNVSSGFETAQKSPLAAALEGTRIADLSNPIEVGLIARSFDACLLCDINIFKNTPEKKVAQVLL